MTPLTPNFQRHHLIAALRLREPSGPDKRVLVARTNQSNSLASETFLMNADNLGLSCSAR